MTPQELKNSILQLAIQGKLVEQRAEEGTGKELLEKILVAKNAKDAEKGKGKSHAKSAKSAKCSGSQFSPISDDEKPFDIPDSWEWVRLGELGILKSGYAFKSAEYTKDGIQVVRISDLGDDVVGLKDAVYYPQKEELSQYLIVDGSFLICMTGSIGKMAWVRDGVLRYLNQRVGMFIPDELCISAYIWFFLHTSYVIEGWIRAKTSTNGNIKNSDITELLIPLPPIAEQKRIVAKIEELLPLVERYEKAWSKLKDFNKSFPVDMQKSILQMAIQGKLVEQRAEEGTGRELLEKILAAKNAKDAEKGKGKVRLTRSRGEHGGGEEAGISNLPKAAKSQPSNTLSAPSASPRDEIPDDEKPFDIPDSWEWVRLGTVIDMLSGFAFKSADFKETGKYRLLRGINLSVGVTRWDDAMYVDDMPEKLKVYRIHKGDVLIGLDRPWISDGIRVAIFDEDEDAYLVQRVLRVRETIAITKEYIALLLRSNLFRNSVEGETTGISVPHISPSQVGGVPIPLPPLAEQKRIVAKIEELLPLCDRLK